MRLVKLNLVLLVIIVSLAVQWRAEAESTLSGCGAAVMQNSSFRITGAVGRSVIGITRSSSAVAYAGSRHFSCGVGNGRDSVSAAPSIASVDGSIDPEAGQNYPNPFNPETWIPYRLAAEANVTIAIYGVRGQLVRILELGIQPVGAYFLKDKAAYWDGRNEAGESVASGIYFYRIQAGEFIVTRKMIVTR